MKVVYSHREASQDIVACGVQSSTTRFPQCLSPKQGDHIVTDILDTIGTIEVICDVFQVGNIEIKNNIPRVFQSIAWPN
ncbi:unnamed protein product [Aspergillus oryzae]|uniref:Unnamed protein product n=2 Tax=Aspergillus oryzae TaxID=5062 RepID=A0AAN4YAR6_ASPOZ|nr:unnamed protein product [Aspergillus oryzae]GMF90460.1 unnamed protein product [Aspergillus oryzae]GMG07511.1 unnamed protein product [Aspergillus oryzae]GMG25886.1 unnamed protein product [Aspergillus oryzae]GMG51018.1 unnamed protein product [Aspergillus oryzae var. brunneus]